MKNAWPFADPPESIAFTLRQIMDGDAPILLVCRDADDGTWQFLDGNPISMGDALLVLLKNVHSMDASIADLAELQVGWQASRTTREGPWVIQRER